MSPRTAAGAATLVGTALLVQLTVLNRLPVPVAAPDLVLVTVAAWGLAHGATGGALVGFAAGLGLDLAPPAAHPLGSWALGLTLAGYLAGSRAGCRAGSRATAAVGAWSGSSTQPRAGSGNARRAVPRERAALAYAVAGALAAVLALAAFSAVRLLVGDLRLPDLPPPSVVGAVAVWAAALTVLAVPVVRALAPPAPET